MGAHAIKLADPIQGTVEPSVSRCTRARRATRSQRENLGAVRDRRRRLAAPALDGMNEQPAHAAVTSRLVGEDDHRRPSDAGMAYSSVRRTVGTWRSGTSRNMPPPMPVMAPRITAWTGSRLNASALVAPVTQKSDNPIASKTTTARYSRSRTARAKKQEKTALRDRLPT